MKTRKDPRHQSRILALQRLFSNHFNDPENESIVTNKQTLDELAASIETEDYNKELAENLVKGVEETTDELDQKIRDYAPQWPIDQIQKVDLEILRIALWEGFVGKITPPKVAIDEAIEIAKEFGGETSSKFVNGVLGAIYEKEKENGEDN